MVGVLTVGDGKDRRRRGARRAPGGSRGAGLRRQAHPRRLRPGRSASRGRRPSRRPARVAGGPEPREGHRPGPPAPCVLASQTRGTVRRGGATSVPGRTLAGADPGHSGNTDDTGRAASGHSGADASRRRRSCAWHGRWCPQACANKAAGPARAAETPDRAEPRRRNRFAAPPRDASRPSAAAVLHVVWFFVFANSGGDLAAQDAWAEFVGRHPGSAYNLAWYGGHAPGLVQRGLAVSDVGARRPDHDDDRRDRLRRAAHA